MPRTVASLSLLALAVLVAAPAPSIAQEPKPATASTPETEEEKKERQTRRQCAVALCSTLHNHKPDTGDVTCSVQKTWRKEILVKIMQRGKVNWPWAPISSSTAPRSSRA